MLNQYEANALDRFKITDRVIVITGGAGLLGREHAEAVIEGGGIAVLFDINLEIIQHTLAVLKEKYGEHVTAEGHVVDITNENSIQTAADKLIEKYGHIDGLINNAANNPKVEKNAPNMKAIQFENFPIDMWTNDIAVGLTGAFLCSKIFGSMMALQGQGIILNISSDLGVIAPDQRIYRKEGLSEDQQMIKPVTYSVIKHGLLGLTKYLATYYAKKGVRCNALCPAGVFNDQNEEFLDKLTNLIPMGRMANIDEYKSTILYLISDASSYMTGSTVIDDGGRTCW